MLSALRPSVPIVAVTDNEQAAARLALWRGVVPMLDALDAGVTAAAARVGQVLVDRGIVHAGAAVVLVSVTPELAPGPSNFLKLQRVG